MYVNNQGHMTKMATMPIYGINPSKIFSGTGGPISKKLGIVQLPNMDLACDLEMCAA